MRLAWDIEDIALTWAAERIPYMHGREFEASARAGAFLNDENRICGVVVFHDWQPDYGTIQVSAVATDPKWMHAHRLWVELFDYAYQTCGVQKIWTLTPHTNKRALRFIKALGFSPEAILEGQFGPHGHAVFSAKWRDVHYAHLAAQAEAVH